MPLPKDQFNLADVLELINDSDSEFEGFDVESDDEFSPYCSNQSSESDSEVDDNSDVLDKRNQSSDLENEWESDDDVPLSSMAKLTPPTKYKWRNVDFQPPDNIEFCGDTRLPDLLTVNDKVTPYSLFKMFISDEMLEPVVNETNQYSVEKNGQSINLSHQECEQLIGVIFYMGLVQMPSLRSYWEIMF